jgi:hypothetical protein
MKLFSFLTLALLLLTALAAGNTVPEMVNYQGYLTALDGSPLNGTFDIVARIFDDSTGGTLITEIPFPTTNVSMGQLKLSIPIPSMDIAPWMGTSTSGWDADHPRFLEIVVEGDILSPRTRLTSNPYPPAACTWSPTAPPSRTAPMSRSKWPSILSPAASGSDPSTA